MGLSEKLRFMFTGFVLSAFFFSVFSFAGAATPPEPPSFTPDFNIKVFKGNNKLSFQGLNKPFLYNGEFYVPISTIKSIIKVKTTADSTRKVIRFGNAFTGQTLPPPNKYSKIPRDGLNFSAVLTTEGIDYGPDGFQIFDDKSLVNKTQTLTYNLNRNYSKFNFSLALDDDSENLTSRLVTIYADNRLLYNRVISKYTLDEGISLNINRASKMTIKVTNDREDRAAYVNFMNPVLVR